MVSFAFNSMHLLLLLSLSKFYSYSKAQADIHFPNCNTAINYTSGNAYEQNLNLTLSSLVSDASLNSFSNVTMGQNQDVVFGRLQCRGEVSNQDCEACAKNAATEIRELCPNQKEASLLDVNCSLQYSYRPFSSVPDSNRMLLLLNRQNASDPVLFNRRLGTLLENLSSNAASSSSKLATGSTGYTNLININAMAQCIGDSTESSCLTCLQLLTSQIPLCCYGNMGGRVISMGCNLRYETYTFFLTPPASSPPELAPSPSPQLSENNSTSNKTIDTTTHSDSVQFLDERGVDSLLMGLSTIKSGTRNFSDANKLGQGGFGPVYKGKLPDGLEVAVKRLSSTSGQGLAELKTEVVLVAKLLHRNLVRLLGFCLEDEEKLLVYEYLPNGSLDKILFDERKKSQLDWESRHKIIVGIARGLLYLHEDSQLRIVHRDLKASNILLDKYMNPKISDFGLARLFPDSQTQANTNRIAGTYGYMAPEYIKTGKFSIKSDIYSFGILILELLAGRKNSNFRNSTNLQSYAWHHWFNGTALEVLDPALGDQWPRDEVLKCLHIGLLCVQDAATYRPTISDIVMMLNSYTITSPAPSRPAFFVSKEGLSELAIENQGASQTDQSGSPGWPQQSNNEVTITDLDPR